MSQYFQQNFLKAQYFKPQYLSGQTDETARSGYWRLFYYQLQEAELKKREQEQGQEAEKRESPSPKKVIATTPRPKISKPTTVELPHVNPRPIYNRETTHFSIEPELRVLSSQFRAEYLSSVPLKEIEPAANDDEVITLLLLLAA